MSDRLVQINFKFNGSKAEYLQAFGGVAKSIAAVPGLHWKVWPWNDGERVGGGIYLFADDASAKAFLEGPIAAALGQHPAVTDIRVKQFDVLEDLTAITRGPVGDLTLA